jgi:WD40 repeat protein
MLASASGDKTVKLWKVDGTLLKSLPGHSSWVMGVSFSPDGKTIASIATAKAVRTQSARHPQWHLVNNQTAPVVCGFDSSTKTSIAQSC